MKSQKGQALVETALILPILLMLLFGITDFGRLFHVYLTLDHAGREAARVAAVGSEDSDVILKVENSSRGLDQVKLKKEILPLGKANRKSGDDVTITLKYPVNFLTPFVGLIIEDFELENKTVMRVE